MVRGILEFTSASRGCSCHPFSFAQVQVESAVWHDATYAIGFVVSASDLGVLVQKTRSLESQVFALHICLLSVLP